jgi:hypothetical protein
MPSKPHYLIELFLEHRADELVAAAKEIEGNPTLARELAEDFLRIAESSDQFEDFRTRVAAADLIGVLGFAKSINVRRKVFALFELLYPEPKLQELANFERLPKGGRCGAMCSEMKLLKSISRVLFREDGEPGLAAARRLKSIFAGTLFGKRVGEYVE